MSGRPLNASRENAILMGDKTYIGLMHDKCGTSERYVKGGGCVHCARIIATEQREARVYLKTHAAPSVQELTDTDIVEPLDNEPEIGLSPSEQAIEDLM